MKILFIVQNSIDHGTYFRAHALAKALTCLGHEMTILASSRDLGKKPTKTRKEGITILTVSNFLPGQFRAGWDIYNLVQRNNIIQSLDLDIVHGFETRPTVIYPALVKQKQGIPLFLDWADWFGKGGSVEERSNPILRTILRPIETYYENQYRLSPQGTTVICQTLMDRALRMGVNEGSLLTLPNGLDTPDWSPPSVNQAKNIIGFEPNLNLIGYLGALFPKDAIFMAEAFTKLRMEKENVKLVHIGNSNNRISNLTTPQQGLIETGPLSQKKVQGFLAACDLFWLPLRNTPANHGRFPLKFTDYLSCGRPVVATNVGDIPFYIQKYQTGFITEDRPDDFAKATITLLNNPKLMANMGQNAFALSRNPKESWLSRAKQLISFYERRI